jgi:hypothetical protein
VATLPTRQEPYSTAKLSPTLTTIRYCSCYARQNMRAEIRFVDHVIRHRCSRRRRGSSITISSGNQKTNFKLKYNCLVVCHLNVGVGSTDIRMLRLTFRGTDNDTRTQQVQVKRTMVHSEGYKSTCRGVHELWTLAIHQRYIIERDPEVWNDLYGS